MLYFRAVANPEQAQADLLRGHSYHQIEGTEYAECDDDDIKELIKSGEVEILANGDYVVPLAGLCGFDNPDRVLDLLRGSACFGPYIAVYRGRYAGAAYDGDLFHPEAIVSVLHEKEFYPNKYYDGEDD